MKRKITQRYLVVFTVSVALIIALWLGLSYVGIFYEDIIEEQSPKYIIHVLNKYIDKQTLSINDEGKEILERNNFWAQVIDKKGKVLNSYNTSEEVPDSYNIFTMSYYALNSDALNGQTVFLETLKNCKDYGVVIGCDSSRVTKYNIQFYGELEKQLLISFSILMVVFILIGIAAGLIFSRTISSPVQDIIADINSLEADINLEPRNYKKNLFSSVYDSLQKLQIRLKSADRERANAERQKNKWISNISHDMKTPLSSIKGYAEIMVDDDYKVSIEERKHFSDIIIRNSENIEDLIEELKFNRLLENGELSLNVEEVNINTLIRECCDELPTQYSKQKILFESEIQLIYATVDRQLMKRCFTNLICNAFVHNEGNVNVHIESFKAGKRFVVKISDNGKGMNAEEIDKVFQRYYRGVSSKRSVGSGLGLAIVKEIVEAHDGEIFVESEIGRGTTFVLRL